MLRALLALRKAEDLDIAKRFAERLGIELVPVSIGIAQWVDEKIVKFEGKGDISYRGKGLPAEAFVERAVEENCDLIIAVSGRKTGHFSNDLATTLAAISPLPVVVIKE